MNKIWILLVLLCSGTMTINAQTAPNFFQTVREADMQLPAGAERKLIPNAYQTWQLDYEALRNQLYGAPMEFTAEARQHPCWTAESAPGNRGVFRLARPRARSPGCVPPPWPRRAPRRRA